MLEIEAAAAIDRTFAVRPARRGQRHMCHQRHRIMTIRSHPVRAVSPFTPPVPPGRARRAMLAVTATAATLWLVLLAAAPPVQAAAADAAEVLGRLRGALGGEAALERVQRLSLAGSYRRLIGERQMEGDLEIAFELPDKFRRTESFGPDPASPMRRTTGFNGQTPIDSLSGGGPNMVVRMGEPRSGMSQEEVQAMRLRAARRDFARLVLALLARSTDAIPLQFAHVGLAESDDGQADVIEATGPDGFTTRLFVDRTTGLPLMLTYKDVAPRVFAIGGPGAPGGPGRPGSPGPNSAEVERRMQELRRQGPPPPSDITVFLSDHRAVGGVMLPHRIRRAVDGQPTEEWEIAEYRVNPTFKAGTFEKRND
jgi:hypothetical protein